jgi:hypothetical protein
MAVSIASVARTQNLERSTSVQPMILERDSATRLMEGIEKELRSLALIQREIERLARTLSRTPLMIEVAEMH